MKNYFKFLCALTFFGCGPVDSADMDYEDELGTLEQGVGFKTGTNFSFGSAVVTGQPHKHGRCSAASGSTQLCTVPRTKGPTYFIDSSLNATEQQIARAAVGDMDSWTNWSFTETTDAANATLTFNRINNFCTGDGIQGIVCVNFTGQGNTLTESPSSIPNTYTEHTKGVIHLDRSGLNACTTCSTGEKNKRMSHGFKAAIGSWMGAGVSGADNASPLRRSVKNPDDTGLLTAGEVCKLNGFLPAGQYGSTTTIGVISNCNAD